MGDDDTPQWRWRWTHYAALGIGALLWIGLWYGAGAMLYFILSLR